MKAIALFVTIGAIFGYGLADYSQPLSLSSPVDVAQADDINQNV